MNAVYWGITGDLVTLCLFFALIFRLLKKYDREGSSLWWAFIGGVLAARLAAGLTVAGLIGYRVATPVRAFVIVCGALVLLWTVRRASYQAAVKTARFSLLLLGFAIFWILPELTGSKIAFVTLDMLKARLGSPGF